MYELERKPDDYQDVSTACASACIDVIATDIDAPFEVWFRSLQAGTSFGNGDGAVAGEIPPFVEAPALVETPPPSITHAEYLSAFELKFTGTLRVEGYFTGSAHSDQGTLVLAEGGEINTDIAVGSAVINGTVVGNINARQRIELGSTARVIGDLHTPALTVLPGAIFEGKCYFQEEPRSRRRRQKASGTEAGEPSDPKIIQPRPPRSGRKKAARKPDWRRS